MGCGAAGVRDVIQAKMAATLDFIKIQIYRKKSEIANIFFFLELQNIIQLNILLLLVAFNKLLY